MLKIRLFIVLVFVVVALVAVGLPELLRVDEESIIRISVPADPDSFVPYASEAAATAEIAFNVFEGLVKSAPDGSIIGALASAWEIDSDQTTYTFTLREAYFHNGQRVEGSDVVNALNNARDPNIARRASELAGITEVTADENVVTIHLERPDSAFLFKLAEFSAVVYPRGSEEQLADRPIGTGPYALVEWRPTQYVRLERFEQYWGDADPYFEVVMFTIIPDANSAVANLKAGQVDLIPRLEASLLSQVETDPRFSVVGAPMNLIQLLALNNDRPPLNDLRVRQAIAHAVDRSEIIDGAAWGYGQAAASGITPSMEAFFLPGLDEIYPTDPDRSRELLAEAEISSLSLTLDLPAPYLLHVQAGEIIAQQLQRAGIDVQIQIIEWGTWLERVYRNRDFDMTIIGLTGRLDPHPLLVRYTADSSRNFVNFRNDRFDELIELGASSAEFQQRVVYYNEAQEILTREVASVFIMDPQELAVMDQGVRGWQSYPLYVVDVATLYRP